MDIKNYSNIVTRKSLLNLRVKEVVKVAKDTMLLSLSPLFSKLPEIKGGQFVNVRITDAPKAILRRPISICNVDYDRQEIWLMVKAVGEGTCKLCESAPGVTYNTLLPLGNGFSMPPREGSRVVLVGGGVGIAPLLYWGKLLKQAGHTPEFILGGRSREDIPLLAEFESLGTTSVTTEDGSMGTKGFVTQSPLFDNNYDYIYTCGPTPMMKAVAAIAAKRAIECEASLENMMACGMGVCLCCVEPTKEGNICVCSEGPVFNTKKLNWND